MKLLQKILGILARLVLKKYKPRIVGITGSIGKTSAREAVVSILGTKFHVRGSEKNYNNELGLPLTIVGANSGGKNPILWSWVFCKAFRLLFTKCHYPEVLALEMGADRPGDIAYLTNIAPPEVGVMTGVSAVHTEFLRDINGVLEEKRTLISVLPPSGMAILNGDDELVMSVAGKTRARVITYGFGEKNDLRALEFVAHYRPGEAPDHSGVLMKLVYNGSVVPAKIQGVLGRQHVYAALAGASVGIAFGMNLIEIAKGLSHYKPPRGRMCLVPGIKKTMLIDDTYNASPRATLEALRALREIEIEENARRIAVIGDMKELGEYTEEGHRGVGEYVAKAGIDILVTVGELARDIARGALHTGMLAENIFEFTDREETGLFVQKELRAGDVVLLKGSQGARMEKITKELMADPLRAKELLVRQNKEWEN